MGRLDRPHNLNLEVVREAVELVLQALIETETVLI